MFLLPDGVLVTSASDLTLASQCEFAFLRKLDQLRGRIERIDAKSDALLDRTAALGDAHEMRVLDAYRARFGEGVAEIERPDPLTLDSMSDAAAASLRAFASGDDVVFQATMFDLDRVTNTAFVGFADFIVRQPGGAYRIEDTKLARSPKVTALLQLAAYADQLDRLGVRVDDVVSLLLGDGTSSEHRVEDLLPVYRLRRVRLLELIELRDREAAGSDGAPVGWGDSRFSICGACDHCAAEIAATRDVLLVANLSRGQRERLLAAGIRTIHDLAASSGPVDGIGPRTLETLRAQATLQCGAVGGDTPPYDVFDTSPIDSLPEPNEGDIFFDFEGDPLYTESGGAAWGLDYLFGLVEADGKFRSFWAHDFAEEGQALRDFLEYLTERRRRYPRMHVYHYASYERTHLAELAIRHGYGEETVDDLFRQHVLVDLYPVVRSSVRVGSPSYSIKKLEPLYMGDDLRDDDGVTTAGDSIVEYARAVESRDAGDLDAFGEKLRSIEDYNACDCRSTLRLRDWLLTLASSGDSKEPSPAPEPRVLSDQAREAIALADELLVHAGDPLTAQKDPERIPIALAAAAVGYHAREDKKTWWEHYGRLLAPIEEWIDQRGVFDVQHTEVERDWFKEGRQRNLRRRLRLTGQAAPGSLLKASTRANSHLLYDVGTDAPRTDSDEPGARVAREATINKIGDGWLVVTEVLGKDEEPFSGLPLALAPGSPIDTKAQRQAIAEWCRAVASDLPEWPPDAASDILRRVPPRTDAGMLPRVEVLDAAKLATALRSVDRSYLAVQGPPGTGKTYVGAHAIAQLVESGWRVGVTAQSHAVIDNFLAAVVRAGLDAESVAHVGGDKPTAYPSVESSKILAWTADQPAGYVVGGTSWVFSNANQIPRGELDLLVIDEAGQFSLANTIAVSVAAQRLLLLGDPQQLPQVSQGVHTQPIDESALGWIAGREPVLPTRFGYFLPLTRRMDAALTTHVSQLSYRGALHAHASNAQRHLAGVEPGLRVERIVHHGNSVSSVEEAIAVVDHVRALLGTPWTDLRAARDSDPLRAEDIIVVTPYNAQRELVLANLAEAGLDGVEVGTVDKFQGREAVIAILTLSASSAADVPRGMEFLINRNRLNVAISRAQWASTIIYSPGLLEHLPTSVAGLKELSAFVRLVGADG